MFDLAFIEDKSPFALHGDGSAPNNSELVKIMCKKSLAAILDFG